MPNQIPLSGATNAAGGFLLPTRPAELLINGLLKEAGAIEMIGDARATNNRSESYPIWLGQPTAGFVGEGARKPVTGAEAGQTTMTVKKIASIVELTDEFVEDLQYDTFNALVDAGVRTAIRDVVDAHIIGKSAGTNVTTAFDTMLRSTTSTVELPASGGDRLRLAISAAMGTLEANGYGNPANIGLILPADIPQHVRDARTAFDATTPVYAESDPFYGLPVAYSTNLNTFATAFAAGVVKGFVVHRPNLHMRIRKDVTVAVSSEAAIDDSAGANPPRYLFQEDMRALRYVMRCGFFAHDINRAVVALVDAAA
jgi:hypothetical protein